MTHSVDDVNSLIYNTMAKLNERSLFDQGHDFIRNEFKHLKGGNVSPTNPQIFLEPLSEQAQVIVPMRTKLLFGALPKLQKDWLTGLIKHLGYSPLGLAALVGAIGAFWSKFDSKSKVQQFDA